MLPGWLNVTAFGGPTEKPFQSTTARGVVCVIARLLPVGGPIVAPPATTCPPFGKTLCARAAPLASSASARSGISLEGLEGWGDIALLPQNVTFSATFAR